jgi:general stress protein YciG
MAEKSNRGFARMSPEQQREIASKGGKAAHAKGKAHHFTPEEARIAGRKGGQTAHARGTAHEFTTEEARAAGRKGGQRQRVRLGGPAVQHPAVQQVAQNLPAILPMPAHSVGAESQPIGNLPSP